MDQLLNLRSETSIFEAMSLLSNGGVQVKNNLSLHPYKNEMDEIDEYCTMICRYLSASNWSAIYPLVQSKLDYMKTCSFEENEIVPNIDILGLLYLDQGAISVIFQDLWQCFSGLRKPLHQSLLTYFFSLSLSYWIYARPEELHNTTVEGSPLQLEASGLFDYVYAAAESSRYSDGIFRFLTVLLCFFPSTFNSNTGVKRFTANSKRFKFLSYLNSNIHTKHIGDGPLEWLGIVASVGSVLMEFDPKSPITQYVIHFHDELYENFASTFIKEITVSLIHTYCEFFIAYSIIDIQNPIRDLKIQFNRHNLEPTMICYITTALRALGAVKTKFHIYTSLINSFSESMRGVMSRQARLLLKSRATGNSSKKSLSTTNSEVVSVPILSNIFQCFIPSPFAYFVGFVEGDYANLAAVAMEPIIPCLLDYDTDLSDSATNFLLSYLDNANLATLDKKVDPSGNHPVVAIYLSACHALNALAEKIIEIDMSDSRLERLLRLIKDLLEGRAKLAKAFHLKEACGGVINRFESKELRNEMYTNVETALLISLCSPDVEIYKLSAASITAALNDSMELENLTDNILSSPFLYNRDQYKNFDLNRYVITGQVALQKRVRKIVRQFTVATDGIINAWEIIYRRATSGFNEQQFKSTFVVERRNYTGMVASLCESILATDSETNFRISDLTLTIHEFVDELVSMLESPNLLVCDAAREILSRELSKFAIKQLFTSLSSLISRVISTGKKEQIFKISDLFISLIRGVITRCIEEKMTLDLIIPDSLLNIMGYLDEMGDDIEVLKMKIRCASLTASLRTNEHLFDVKLPSKVYYSSAVKMLKWFEQGAFKGEPENFTGSLSTSDRKQSELDHVYADLALESAKAASYMTKGITISVPQTSSEEDYLQAKSTSCASFFSTGIRALDKYTGSGAFNMNSSSSVIAKTIGSLDSSQSGGKQISKRYDTICLYVISMLSNLLKMNSDVGLKFAIPIGYHSSPKVRGAFIQLLSNILQQGVNSGIGENEDEKFHTLLCYIRSNLSVAVLLCDICPAGEADELASALLNLYATNGSSLTLIKAALTKEIQITTKVVELLRRNSVATRMLVIYAKKYGASYLSSTLSPILQSFSDDPSGHIFELSADKLSESKKNDNIEKFMKCISTFSKAFTRSLHNMPEAFKEICYTIRTVAIQSFPEAGATSVGAFIFLRFFCPAIVAPEANNLVKSPLRREIRRSLLLVAKVIQNMANGSLYSLKMPLLYERMGELNQINDQITKFLVESTILSGKPHDKDDSLFDFTSLIEMEAKDDSAIDMNKKEVMFIHEFLYSHLDTINSKAASSLLDTGTINSRSGSYRNSDVESLPSVSGSMISNPDSLVVARLDELVEAIGQPRQSKGYQVPEQILVNTKENGTLLYEFMSRNAAKDFGPILEKQMVKEGVSDDGLPFIVMSLGMFDNNTVTDPDMVTYRIFQILSKVWNDKYSFFIDATGFDERNVVDNSIFTSLLAMTPIFASENCCALYYVNCSTHFLPHMNQISKVFGDARVFNPSFVPYRFVCTFYEDLPIQPYGMSKKTRTIIHDSKTEYTEVFQYDDLKKDFVGVEMKVGEEYVQICRNDPVAVECGGRTVYIRLYDTYHATDLKDVKSSNRNGEASFIFNFEDRASKVFSSPKRNEIVRDVNAMITRYSEHSSSASLTDNAINSLRDVTSMLTNVGLFGLNSEDNETRNASFNLMSTLYSMYELEGEIGHSRTGLYFPKHDTQYFVSLSETLSQRFPIWTYDFCKSFISAFKQVDRKDRNMDSGSHTLSPWIKNIFKSVYSDNEKRGARRTKYLIRELVKITERSFKHLSTLQMEIWKPLFQQKGLTPLLVDIIISSAIDRQAAGEDCEVVLSLLGILPSEEACGIVLQKIRNLTSVPIDASNEAEEFVYSTVSWNEVTVLVKACIPLLFDSCELNVKFLVDICFIGTCFTNMGPYELKSAVHKLTVNTIHSFSSIKTLSPQEKNLINQVLDKYTGKRASLLFGLNSTSDDEITIHDPTMIAGLTEITEGSLAALDIIGDGEGVKQNQWRKEWTEYAFDAAFKKGSIVRARALIVLGILAEENNAEYFTKKTVTLLRLSTKLAVNNDASALDLNNCIINCLGRLTQKLPPTSPFLTSLFWEALSCTQFPFINFFISCSTLVLKCMERIAEANDFDGDIIGKLTRVRSSFGSTYKEIDNLVGLKYNTEMFDNYILAMLCRGLYVSATKYHTLNILSGILKVRINSDKILIIKRGPGAINDDSKMYPYVYACFLFIYARSHKEVAKYLSCLDKQSIKLLNFGDGIQLPRILLDFFASGTDQSVVATYLAANIFKDPKVEEALFMKAIRWHLLPADTDEGHRMRFMNFAYYEKRIQEVCEHSANQATVEICQKLITAIMAIPDFDYDHRNLYIEEFFRIPKMYKFENPLYKELSGVPVIDGSKLISLLGDSITKSLSMVN